jgi:hypothetical protein
MRQHTARETPNQMMDRAQASIQVLSLDPSLPLFLSPSLPRPALPLSLPLSLALLSSRSPVLSLIV